MITAVFYTHRKRSNSTLQPSGGTTHEIVLKDNCGVLNPVIELFTENPASYNYAYIPAFSRYYYVTEWSYFKGVWTANLSVDVLASYKSYIGAENLYVLRSSVEWDGNVPDETYPALKHEIITNMYDSPFAQTGMVCVSIAGQDTGVVHRVIPESRMPDFMDALFTGAITGIDPGDFTMDMYKSLTNPAQYLTGALWFPSNSIWFGNVAPVKVGWWNVNFTAHDINYDNLGAYAVSISVDIPKHPQIEERGAFLQNAPWSTYKLTFPCFGEIELNPTDLYNVESLDCRVTADPYSGGGRLDIFAGNKLIRSLCGAVGVDYALSALSYNPAGVASGVVSAGKGLISTAVSAFTGGGIGLLSGVKQVASGVSDVAKNAMPDVYTTGTMGGISQFRQNVVVRGKFAIVAEDDVSHHGRPLCKKRVISSLGGFVQVLDGDIKAPCTESENSSIQSYLEGGIYFE